MREMMIRLGAGRRRAPYRPEAAGAAGRGPRPVKQDPRHKVSGRSCRLTGFLSNRRKNGYVWAHALLSARWPIILADNSIK